MAFFYLYGVADYLRTWLFDHAAFLWNKGSVKQSSSIFSSRFFLFARYRGS